MASSAHQQSRALMQDGKGIHEEKTTVAIDPVPATANSFRSGSSSGHDVSMGLSRQSKDAKLI